MRWLGRAAFAVSACDDDGAAGSRRRNGGAESPAETRDSHGSRNALARPSLPLIGFLAFSLWAGAAASFYGLLSVGSAVRWLVSLVCVVAAIAVMVAVWRRKGAATLLFVALGACLGICLSSVNLCVWESQIGAAEGKSAEWDCVAAADGQTGSYGQTVLADVSSEKGSFRVRISLDSGADAVRFGDRFSAWGSIKSPTETQRESFCSKGAVGSLKAYSVEPATKTSVVGLLAKVRNRAIEFLQPFSARDGGVTAAIVCGWRGDLDDGVYRSFQVSGLAHIVAVSGAHLSLVAAFVASILRVARAPRWLSCALQVAFVLAYLVFTAVPVSAMRAAVMTLAGLTAWTAKRRPSSLNALSICVIAFIGIDSTTAVSVSFALSTLSTLGIVVFGRLFSAWAGELLPRCPSFVVDAVSLTVASSLVAAPFSAALFSQFPVVAPVSNVLTAPLFGPVCTLGLLASACALAVPGIALIAGNACSWATFLLCKVVGFTASFPWASVPVDVSEAFALFASAVVCAALWIAWPAPRQVDFAKAGACAVPVVLVIAALILFGPKPTELIMLDVGQGDAIVLRSRGSTLLVDTGNQDAKLREALARQGISKLDAVLITHPDDDHMASLPSLRGVVEVSSVIVADGVGKCGCANCRKLIANADGLVGQDGVRSLSAEDVISVGDWRATCIWPREFTDEGGNADSICLMAQADPDGDGEPDESALLVGDAEHDQLQQLIDAGKLGNVDVYKVGHHGSKNAITQGQAQTLSPKLSLVSVGANNRYGHPNAKTTSALEAAGSTIVRTDESGDIVCEFGAGGITVRTLR